MCFVVHGRAFEAERMSAGFREYQDYVREIYGPIVDLSRAQYASRAGVEYNGWIEPRKFFATRPDSQH